MLYDVKRFDEHTHTHARALYDSSAVVYIHPKRVPPQSRTLPPTKRNNSLTLSLTARLIRHAAAAGLTKLTVRDNGPNLQRILR